MECGILNWAAAFACFCGISVFSWNFAEFSADRWYRGQIWHALVGIRRPYCNMSCHDIHDCHSGSNGKNTENIELSLFGRQTVVSVSCSYQQLILHIWSGSAGYNINYYMRKIAVVSRGIWQTGRQNWEIFAA